MCAVLFTVTANMAKETIFTTLISIHHVHAGRCLNFFFHSDSVFCVSLACSAKQEALKKNLPFKLRIKGALSLFVLFIYFSCILISTKKSPQRTNSAEVETGMWI